MMKPSHAAWRWNDSDGGSRRPAAASRRTWPSALVLSLAFVAVASRRPGPSRSSIRRVARRRVAAPIAVVVPAGVPAQILLQAIAPGKLGALVEGFAPEHVIYVDPRVAALPQIAMLTRSAAPGDVDAVAALKPGLVVDYGSLSPRYVAADEKIAQELKVPAVLFSGDLADVPNVVRMLAKPLGAAERGDAVADAAQRLLDRLKPLGALSDADRVAVYVARGTDGLTAERAGTSFDEPIRLAGGPQRRHRRRRHLPSHGGRWRWWR